MRDLRELYGHAFTARQVAELELMTCQSDEPGVDALSRMRARGFEALPLVEAGQIVGYVTADGLGDGPCGAHARRFESGDLVAESTPLGELAAILRDRPRLFVLVGNRVRGIVTRADLQKAPVRMWLFGLVTLLEMHLLRLVRRAYPQESWQAALKPAHLAAARQLLHRRQERDEAIDLADCLQFYDKRDLVLRLPALREGLGFASKREAERVLGPAEELRDRLAHAQDLLAGGSWADVFDLAKRIEALLERCEAIGLDPAAATG